MLKYHFSRKTKNAAFIIAIILGLAALIYLAGIITQVFEKIFFKVITTIEFNPIINFKEAFNFKYSKFAWIVLGVLALVIVGYIFLMSDKRGKLDSNAKKSEDYNFEYSGKETYGSARKMTESDIKEHYRVVPSNDKGIEKTNGAVIFGFLNEKKKDIVSMPESDWRKGTDYNRNIAVCGPPGSNKTRGFVMNYIIQKMLAGESIVVVDTKGEIYSRIYNFALKMGYVSKILNLVEQDCSDGWDILGEVENNPDMATELASTIIRNTGGEKGDPFWNEAEMNMLKAVILLKSVGKVDISNPSGEKQTMGDVYKYIATRKIFIKEGGGDSMEADFQFIRERMPDHPAITPFLQFLNADDLCKKILHGLANRLQLFQNAQLSNVLGTKDIDLTRAGKQKSIYFLRFSDQTSTYAFITALYFSFMSVKLVKYADSTPERRLPIPVNLVLDEFCNIGAIPDFEVKMATFRSRMINVVIIYQNNMLLKVTYPDDLWEAILATCDTLVVLGVGNELTTANYISQMTGEATTSVGSASVIVTDVSQMRTTSSTGKRYVMTADEIRRMDKRKALVFLRSCQVMEIWKMDFTENPTYQSNKSVFDKEVQVTDHQTIVEKVDIDYTKYRVTEADRFSYVSTIGNKKPKSDGNGSDNNTPKPKSKDKPESKKRKEADRMREPDQKRNRAHKPSGPNLDFFDTDID